MILLDANVLLRLARRNDPDYQRTQSMIFDYRKVDSLVICPQSIFEFWAVATRSPEVNGIGMETAPARQWVKASVRLFRFLPDPENLAQVWSDIVAKHDNKGFRAHDARYVAFTQLHRISHLMTYNVKHFSIFGIQIIDPAQVGPT